MFHLHGCSLSAEMSEMHLVVTSNVSTNMMLTYNHLMGCICISCLFLYFMELTLCYILYILKI